MVRVMSGEYWWMWGLVVCVAIWDKLTIGDECGGEWWLIKVVAVSVVVMRGDGECGDWWWVWCMVMGIMIGDGYDDWCGIEWMLI